MGTKYEMPEEYIQPFLEIAKNKPRFNDTIPLKFIKKMKENQGIIHDFSKYGLDERGLERKNPVIVVLGDSVSAGHFEMKCTVAEMWDYLKREEQLPFITDLQQVYHEKFRQKLHELYEVTAVSVINAGICGDSIASMEKRLYRDVLRYEPDLVIINGSLNWGKGHGDLPTFKKHYENVVKTIKNSIDTDIILLTPNMAIEFEGDPKLIDRVNIIREIAIANNVCIADVYAIWEQFVTEDIDLSKMFGNELNHPTPIGHEVYAIELMKLF